MVACPSDNLSNAVITDGSFVTEHSILLAEGHFQDGVLVVHRLGQPLPETRADSLAAIQQQVSHPYYSTIRTTTKNNKKLSSSVVETQQSFVILSDVQADHPRVMQRLEAILARYEKRVSADDEHNSDDALPLFVLMGPFSCISSSQQQQQSGADDLVALVARLFPRLAQTAHFCLVPSHDAMGVLPFAASSKKQSSNNHNKLRHCHWASNPCRLRWAGREMVIFRYDLLPLLQQHSMGLPGIVDTEQEDASEKPPSPYKRLIRTVLDQSCLVPVAGTPVYWNYHHALSLYPLPDCLVLTNGTGSGSQQHYTERYLDCRVIVAGSLMAPTGTYAVYRPGRDGEEDDKVDRFGMESDKDNEKAMAGSSAGVKFISLDYLSKKETKSRK